ncbi:hypothetical protein [Nocardia sputorum]|uniref:DNA primase n=1 Tax=Nocardia sputorum TaxID=2984338 RepID=A0ABN6TZ21_9NOCA|nr:hypothetical protein [Nocardia sputorum]BDT98010.1 hypothetical protein IFM12276_10390 [Nocardia sputorum]
MKGGGRIALGVGIGYFLGRTRKMRFAMSLAGAAMARRSAGAPGGLLERGTELLRSTPELTRITDTVRDELVGAVRSAAVTAASNRIDALSDRLQQGATALTDQGRRGARATDSDEDEYEDESSEYDEEAPEDEDEDQAPEDEYEDEDQAPEDEAEDEDQGPEDEAEERTPDNELEDEYEDEDQMPDDEEDADQGAAEDDTERPAARTRTRRSSTAARRAASSRSADRSSDSADRKPSGTGGRRSRAEAGQAPVRRTRR